MPPSLLDEHAICNVQAGLNANLLARSFVPSFHLMPIHPVSRHPLARLLRSPAPTCCVDLFTRLSLIAADPCTAYAYEATFDHHLAVESPIRLISTHSLIRVLPDCGIGTRICAHTFQRPQNLLKRSLLCSTLIEATVGSFSNETTINGQVSSSISSPWFGAKKACLIPPRTHKLACRVLNKSWPFNTNHL